MDNLVVEHLTMYIQMLHDELPLCTFVLDKSAC